ncbi:MAG: 30S ribosomal protein S1 [Gammaproteobacteria bacterium]|nr:30S ribosomal protein S1 [Gammaproteobacteria bacterium]
MTENEDFASLFGEFEKQQTVTGNKAPKIGDTVKGKVVSIQKDDIFIDLGAKTEGIVEREELIDEAGELTVSIGDVIEIAVSGNDEATGTLILGSQHARRMHGIEGLRQAYAEKHPVEGLVTGTTKGGLEVEMSNVRAFCPASQIDDNYVEDLETFVGERLAFRITKIEGGRHPNLVVSRRVLLEEEKKARASQTRSQLEVGVVMQGTVSSLKDFGAFIDLGGIEGMVHISELSFGRIEHPQEILSVGQQVEVQVLKIEQTDNPRHPERIALSIRALEPDPWRDVLTDYPVGAQVEGTVIRLQPFGAFIELAPGIDGLAHISELGAGRRISHPQEVLNLGERVQAKVLSVDTEKQRIGLSLDNPVKSEKKEQDDEAKINLADYGKPKQSFGTLGDLLKESLKKQK